MFIEIKTDRLILRPLDISDLETVHIYASDNENTLYMYWLPNNTKEETTEFLDNVTLEWKKESPNYYEFAIILDGLQIGAISIALDDTKNVGELGWIINKKFWERGIATEAAFAIKEFALTSLHLEKITANCDYRNVASYNLMQKIGMTLENDTGTRTYPKNGETVQELTYSLLAKR